RRGRRGVLNRDGKATRHGQTIPKRGRIQEFVRSPAEDPCRGTQGAAPHLAAENRHRAVTRQTVRPPRSNLVTQGRVRSGTSVSAKSADDQGCRSLDWTGS